MVDDGGGMRRKTKQKQANEDSEKERIERRRSRRKEGGNREGARRKVTHFGQATSSAVLGVHFECTFCSLLPFLLLL